MEAKLVLQQKSPFPQSAHRNNMYKFKPSRCTLDVSRRPAENVEALTSSKSVYNDSWFDRIAIDHLSQNVQAATGLKNNKSGYPSLVEAAMVASRAFSENHQQKLIIEALQKAFPKPILSVIKILLPPSEFSRKYFAVFTTIFFAWLVGPCEVRESEFNGRRESNVVHIKKCRFLEETNCVGMCTNLCKMPSQIFIKESLGIPVNMVPSLVHRLNGGPRPQTTKETTLQVDPSKLSSDFDDMSCQMIFGQDPPQPSDDPAFHQPCYKLCNAKKKHNTICTS